MTVAQQTAPLWAVYIRRSMKKEGDADVSDATQEAAARARVPAGGRVIVLSDSGGHNSGHSDQRLQYQRLLAMVRAGEIAGIAAYDGSRLNRNAENALALYRECSARAVVILTGETSAQSQGTAEGTLTYTLHAGIAQYYRDQQSARIRAMATTLFESGRQRGPDPLGYRTIRDDKGRVAQPRTLEIVPEEADAVRRAFAALVDVPMSEAAAALNRDGVPYRAGRHWTKDAVRDLWRRRRMYMGYAVRKRSTDERPGTHSPILSEDQYNAAVVGVERRRTSNSSPKVAQRVYLLRGLIYCASCGIRMTGDSRTRGKKEWRYYACPVAARRVTHNATGEPISCANRRVPAGPAEDAILRHLSEARLPDDLIEEARRLLKERLAKPTDNADVSKRRRLERALESLRKQHTWGDLSDEAYRAEKLAIESDLARLPASSTDTLIAFDEARARLLSMPEAIAAASPEHRAEVVRLVIDRVVADREHGLVALEWTPPAAPFFRRVVLSERAVWDSNPRHED
jgi:site-specific DNA recombinase